MQNGLIKVTWKVHQKHYLLINLPSPHTQS